MSIYKEDENGWWHCSDCNSEWGQGFINNLYYFYYCPRCGGEIEKFVDYEEEEES